MKKLLYALLPLALASCGGASTKTPANQLAFNSFDQLEGWTNGAPANPSLTKDKAHSGDYSVKVAPGIDYSLGYNDQLGHLSAARVAKIRLHGWVFLPNDKAGVVLVTEVGNPGEPKPLNWDGLDLLKEAKDKSSLNQWLEIDHTVDIAPAANYLSVMKVYLWRSSSSQPAYLDDLQILKAD